MKRAGWIALIAVELCAVAAALWWRFGDEPSQPAEAGDSTQSLPASAASEDAPAVAQESAPAQSEETPPPLEREDYAAQFRAASDYLDFARSLLPAARAGDHAAQFYIFRTLDYCNVEFRMFFYRQGVRQTLDGALKMAVARNWPFDSEEVRRVHARCHTLMESAPEDFGERHEWLKLASEGGYPLAQVVTAQQQFRESIRTNGDNDARAEQRRSLVAQAIRSRDPEVIWEIGDTPVKPFKPVTEEDTEGVAEDDTEDESQVNQFAWFVAACQRGFDCSAQSNAVRVLCSFDRNCQPYETVTDIFRRSIGNVFPEIDARARWINEKIDAGDWEALGF